MKKLSFIPLVFFIAVIIIFFQKFLINQQLPIPADTIVGLYHPFRDAWAKQYPSGIPFKNFLITDPVRQQYPWKELVISLEKNGELPLWNPYNFAGTPLLANFQSAAFYPLNIIFFITPFSYGWSVLVVLQPLLAGLFLYLYLTNLGTKKIAGMLGAIVFASSGFSTAWLEWNTILHVVLWLPLILLSIDKVFLKNQNLITWGIVFTFGLISSFFAGHLQTFFYLFIVTTIYLLARLIQYKRNIKTFLLFTICFLLFVAITAIQWIQTTQFIALSARNIDQMDWQRDGWFIPWQHLIQFVAPDFFGNPTTLNYWGVWNYGEFVGYIGIMPLVMAIYALFFRRDKKTLLFGTFFFLSLIFSLPTIIAKISFILQIPLFSTSQPTRLLFITDFSLAILSALGFDYFIRNKKGIIYAVGFIGIVFIGVWLFVIIDGLAAISLENLVVAKRNLLLPTVIFANVALLLIILWRFKKISRHITIMIYIIIVGITVFDLFRFGQKFTPFSPQQYLFPNTRLITFLQRNTGNYRIMSTDSRILPPNFSLIYRLQSVEGYDPLFTQRYAELIVASERGKPDITSPFGFNRIITPHRFDSKIIDLLGVKYILSLSDLSSPKLKKVFQEGQTRVYENSNVLPRAFFVRDSYQVFNADKNEEIRLLFDPNFNPREKAVIEHTYPLRGGKLDTPWSVGKANIIAYSENTVKIETENEGNGFLVLMDSFYPLWHARIYSDRSGQSYDTKIYRTNYNFRGVFVPKGKHIVVFYISLL